MTLEQAIDARHSVRAFKDVAVFKDTAEKLLKFIQDNNVDSRINIQLVLNEPKAFDCFLAHYGKFKNVKNYIAIVADKSKDVYEMIGYLGEKVVLYAQTLGLNTCWVALTYKKINDKIVIKKGQKLHVVIALGYGETQGKPRKSKSINDVCNLSNSTPEWFINGVKSALKAPTAINQQKFRFELKNGEVFAKAGRGFYSKMDLGIVKLHFEIGANKKNLFFKK